MNTRYSLYWLSKLIRDHIAQNSGGESFGGLKLICQYFTLPNLH